MTGGSFIGRKIPDEDVVNQRRIRTGYLDQIVCLKTIKTKRRWVVFQGDTQNGLFQLKIFKKMDEKILKSAYTVNKDTFMGTERGMMQRPGKRKSPIEYWAIMLAADTILFQESKSVSRDLFVKKMASEDLATWYAFIKSHFFSESWTVFPLKGIVAPEFRMALHVTHHAMCLATLSPPKCCNAWDLKRIAQFSIQEETLGFHIDSTGSDAGYCELKTESKKTAGEIFRILSRHHSKGSIRGALPKLPPMEPTVAPPLLFMRPDLKPGAIPGPERYTASPSRLRSRPPQPPIPHPGASPDPLTNGRHCDSILDDSDLDECEVEGLHEETHVDMLSLMMSSDDSDRDEITAGKFIGVSETHWKESGDFTEGGYKVLCASEEDVHRRGVALILNKQAQKAFLGYNTISPRLISARFQTQVGAFTIIQVYAPNMADREETIDTF
eukprot:XP_003730495.2 PREDICTED: uncharacterized protein LOC100893704 [Strongylocentrotus purpuratus]